MGLINKLFEPVKSFVQKRKNEICLFTTLSLLSLITSCSDTSGSSDKKDKEPVNNAPVAEAQADGVINENSQFYRDFNATDKDKDELTYYFIDSPTNSNIDSATGEITFTPNDSQSNQWHNFTVGVSDGELSDEKTFKVYAVNVETASGNVKAFADDSNISNIKISMDNTVNGTYTAWTDANGNWQIEDMPDGDYHTILRDDNAVPVYIDYCPGKFVVNKTKASEGKLERNCKLSKLEIYNYLCDVERYNYELRKWNAKPKFRIFTKDEYDGNIADASRMAGLTSRITDSDKLSGFFQDTYNLTTDDIEVINSTRAEYFNGKIQEEIDALEEGYITITFDDWNIAPGAGGNICYFDGDKNITKVNIRLNTTDIGDKTTQADIQELSEGAIGSGETNDPFCKDSRFYDKYEPSDPEPIGTSYSPEDWETSKRHYKQEFQRTSRNSLYAGIDDYDPGQENDDSVVWNK